jgi:hypothetical protein
MAGENLPFFCGVNCRYEDLGVGAGGGYGTNTNGGLVESDAG